MGSAPKRASMESMGLKLKGSNLNIKDLKTRGRRARDLEPAT